MRKIDVLVIGAGLAGAAAGIAAKRCTPWQTIALAAPRPLYDGGCGRETHAFNAAVGPGDSWMDHFHDTMLGGGLINDPRLAALLCKGAVDVVGELEELGVSFDTHASGEHDLGTYGGSSRSRGLHRADLTGFDISVAQAREAIAAGCVLLDGLWLVDLAIEDGECHGAVFYDAATGMLRFIGAKTTVLATGGGACVYPIASISSDKQATGIATGLRHGLPCVDMEMVQFHPTGLAAPGTAGHGTLLEEELRTLGAKLLNAEGERFMNSFDPRGERATRDVVSRGCFMEILAGRGTDRGGVLLDISELECESLLERFPNSVRRLRACGVDLLDEKLIDTCPTAHFLMGGLEIDDHARTGTSRLFACGEDAGGVHGGNRLGGNGVAEALVFGRIAGTEAALTATIADTPMPASAPPVVFNEVPEDEFHRLDQDLRELMWREGGLARSHDGLVHAHEAIVAMREDLAAQEVAIAHGSCERLRTALVEGRSLANRLLLAESIVTSAIERPRSLAAHYRTDSAAGTDETPYSVGVKLLDGHLQASRVVRRELETGVNAAVAVAA